MQEFEHAMIDIDGHIVEPGDLWESRVDARFRDQAIRVVRSRDGMARWLVRGKPSKVFPAITPLVPGLYDRLRALGEESWGEEWLRLLQQDYAQSSAPGAAEPSARLAVMDGQGIQASLLFPTLGLSWEEEALDDAEYTYAHMRAYNDWILDFCSHEPRRLLPAVQISLLDPEAAVAEIERTSRRGARAVVLRPLAVQGRPPSHPHFDRIWGALECHNLSLALHVLAPQRTLLNWGRVTRKSIFHKVHDTLPQILGVTDLILGGVLTRFPRLRICCLEIGALWLPWILGTMDDKAGEPVTNIFRSELRPSEIFRRQCWVTPNPRDPLRWVLEEFEAEDMVMAYTDYPHPEVKEDMAGFWRESLAPYTQEIRQKFLRTNALRFLDLEEAHVLGHGQA